MQKHNFICCNKYPWDSECCSMWSSWRCEIWSLRTVVQPRTWDNWSTKMLFTCRVILFFKWVLVHTFLIRFFFLCAYFLLYSAIYRCLLELFFFLQSFSQYLENHLNITKLEDIKLLSSREVRRRVFFFYFFLLFLLPSMLRN